MSQKNIEDIYPLSPLQQGILFHTLYAAEPGAYFVHLGWTFRGPLDAAAFIQAFHDVIDRNPILRTAFVWERLEKPMQIVREQVKLPALQVDLRAFPAEERAARIQRYLETDRRKGFDLTKAPLLRLAVFRTGDEEHTIVSSRHHLILDGWSLPLLFKELFACYEARRTGVEPRLPPARPYGEYIEWLGQQDLRSAEAFFRGQLGGFTAPTPFSVDSASSSSPSSTSAGEAGGRYDDRRIELPEAQTAALLSFARKQKLTASTLLQGAWALLLSRYSGEEDVVFGVTVSGRSAPLPGIEQMMGLFINTLPVRVSASPGEGVLPFLRALQDRLSEMRDHEQTPLIEVQGWSGVPRGTPLFESIVVFENYPVDASLRQGTGRLAVDELWSSSRAIYPLSVVATLHHTLSLRIDFDQDR
ncbi:MAG: condensation domain-containing protein, partial [Minicystis sp.]